MYEGHERRTDDLQVEAIVCAIKEELSAFTVPHEIHQEHHEFIRQWIEKQKRREERFEKIKTQVGGWAVIAFLGGIGTAAYHLFQMAVREATK